MGSDESGSRYKGSHFSWRSLLGGRDHRMVLQSMTLLLRLVDKTTGQVVPCDKLVFHLGKLHIVNDYVAKNYEVQMRQLKEPDGIAGSLFEWVPVDLGFEG